MAAEDIRRHYGLTAVEYDTTPPPMRPTLLRPGLAWAWPWVAAILAPTLFLFGAVAGIKRESGSWNLEQAVAAIRCRQASPMSPFGASSSSPPIPAKVGCQVHFATFIPPAPYRSARPATTVRC